MPYLALLVFVFFFNLVACNLQAQTIREVEYISSSVIKKAATGPDTAPNLKATTLHTGEVYKYMVARRTGSGQVEAHTSLDDIFQVQ